MIQVHTQTKEILADTVTPVGIYLKLRELYPKSVLLEGSDYHGDENSYSMICLQPLAYFTVHQSRARAFMEDELILDKEITGIHLPSIMSEFFGSFTFGHRDNGKTRNGFYGYSAYDAVRYFEEIELHAPADKNTLIPEVYYSLYRFVIAINHFRNVMYITENIPSGKDSELNRLENLIRNLTITTGRFSLKGETISDCSDSEFKERVKQGKRSCFRGDVFQIVLSRRFSQVFEGDDFNVYRVLRSINPSPYLFYFDYGDYHIFGSSPEIHLRIQDDRAYINPIAGTFRRSGNDATDKEKSEKLLADPKENAEHMMLVDLARNDLSRYGEDVKIEKLQEIKYYSHVIHMVSTVSARLNDHVNSMDVFASTFPAGTLSGAPKYKAMQLIDRFENLARGYYGGAIGYFGLDKSINHAIMIRTFLSRKQHLFFQAGAGVVAGSSEENELQEVNNKLAALNSALKLAEKL